MFSIIPNIFFPWLPFKAVKLLFISRSSAGNREVYRGSAISHHEHKHERFCVSSFHGRLSAIQKQDGVCVCVCQGRQRFSHTYTDRGIDIDLGARLLSSAEEDPVEHAADGMSEPTCQPTHTHTHTTT